MEYVVEVQVTTPHATLVSAADEQAAAEIAKAQHRRHRGSGTRVEVVKVTPVPHL